MDEEFAPDTRRQVADVLQLLDQTGAYAWVAGYLLPTQSPAELDDLLAHLQDIKLYQQHADALRVARAEDDRREAGQQ